MISGTCQKAAELLISDPHVLHGLIVADQVPQGRGEVFVGDQHGYKGAKGQLPLDYEIDAARVEEEWCQLRYQIAQSLHEKLKLVDHEKDRLYAPQRFVYRQDHGTIVNTDAATQP